MLFQINNYVKFNFYSILNEMEVKKPKVSIVIPTYNSLDSLRRTLDSVLIQNFQDYEIIITDDSKNDKIKDFVEQFNFPRIKYNKNKPSLGSPENWNEGIRRTSGEYIKIIHHDDWLADKDTLEKFVKLMDENPQCDFGYSKSVDVKIKTGKIKKRKAQKYVSEIQKDCFMLFLSNRIGAPSVTIFRNNKNIFFDKNLKWLVDIDFYINALSKNPKIAFIDENLIKIGVSDIQITQACLQDNVIEIAEKLYLYNKYKAHLQEPKYMESILETLKESGIKTLKELKEKVKDETIIPPEVITSFDKKPIFQRLIQHISL